VKVLDNKNCSEILRINCKELLKNSMHTSIRSVCLSQDSRKLLIGTYGSEIYELITDDAKITTNT
jgi:hypothetical protein